MITLKDISIECGVSPATVSKALNNQSDVSEARKKHIRKVAKDMGYLPNAAARALKTHKSHNIGVLFVDNMQSGLAHEYFSAVLNSVKVEAEKLGYDITFITSNIGSLRMSYLEHCKYRNCDGVVIACVDFEDPMVVELIKSNIPTVSIDYIFDNRTSILSDNVKGAEDLVKHIYEKGHRKIAFIHGENTSVTRKRLGGFHNVCSELELDIPDQYFKRARYHDPKSSYEATKELLALKDRPTCVMYPDDFSLVGGMNYIEKAGLRIPEDISVVGYDGIYLSQVLRPRITTLKQDTNALGTKAADLLIKMIENPKKAMPVQLLVQGELLEGKSIKDINEK